MNADKYRWFKPHADDPILIKLYPNFFQPVINPNKQRGSVEFILQ